MNILYKILNEALLQWNDSSDIEDSGLIKASDVENRMKTQLVYKIDELKRINLFGSGSGYIYEKFKDKIYIEGEHVQLDEDGCTVNVYKPGEYRVYIENFDKIEEIYSHAFKMSDLMSINIPDSVTSIGDGAFYKCASLSSVNIPDSVTSIGEFAFMGCTGLTSMTIPNSVTSIGIAAFAGCSGLTSVTISNSVTSIGNSAFENCSELTSVTIPNSVKKIGSGVFQGCTGLTSMVVEGGNTEYDSHNNCNAIIETATNTLISGCKNTIIPNSVTKIGDWAFYACAGLTSITIPDSVTSIRWGAFEDCTGLTSVTIPDSVTYIGHQVFTGCANLKKVYVESIDKFNEIEFKSGTSDPTCYGAELIELKKDLNEALLQWNDSDIEDLGIIKTSDVENRMKDPQLVYKLNKPRKIKIFDSNSIYRKFKDKVYINGVYVQLDRYGYTVNEYEPGEYRTYIEGFDKLKKIYVTAFDGCRNLFSVIIPNSVAEIGTGAFAWCRGLTSVTIPSKVKKIGTQAFWYCTGLTSVTIPNSVTSIGYHAFYQCTGLTSVTWNAKACDDFDYYSYPFENLENVTSFSFGDEVEKIPAYLCCGLTGLTSVTIPNSVTWIGSAAFHRCKNLKKVYVEDIDKFNEICFLTKTSNPTCYGAELIELKKGLNEALLQWNDSSDIEDTGLIKASDIENRMKTQLVYKIDELKRIRIFYANIEDPDDTRYTYSEYKDKVYVNGEHVKLDGKGYTVNEYEPGKYRVYIEDFDKLEEIEDFTFYECTDLMSIIIPNSITTISCGAFCGCSGLTSVTIPNSVTLIDNSAFQNCSGLTSIDIPNTVREIYSSAFSDCTGLTSVTIPNSVTLIGNSAFSGCTGLTSVTIPSSVTEMGGCVFYDCTNLKTIYVESISKFKKIKFSGWGDKSKLLRKVKLIELKKDLNEALLQWNDSSDIEDTGLIKASDIENSMRPYLIYKVDLNRYDNIKIFERNTSIYKKYKDKVYINGEHIELDQNGYTVKEYESGEYRVYIEDFNKLEEICHKAFTDCIELTSVTIPDSVTKIGEFAFRGCSRLTSITIPDSVTTIGAAAFYNCDCLTSVTIPDSVTKIGNSAFMECSRLTSITIPDSVSIIGGSAFQGCTGLTSITIPDSVTLISDYAFYCCTSLISIEIPNSVTKINEYTFVGCSSLTSVTIPNTVITIGHRAFESCSSLKSVAIPDSVTKIGNGAFSDCTGLTSVTISNSVTEIGKFAFWNCKNLKKVYVESIDKFNEIYFIHETSNPTYYGAELVELKQGLNEALISWDDSDTEDDSHILNHHNIKRSFERIDLNDYKKSVAYWQNQNKNYPWFKNYINDIINLYFNNKQDFEKYIKTCINDSYGGSDLRSEEIYYSVINNYGLFIDKLFRIPDESELKAIVDITKYVPLKWQSTFWNVAIFGDRGLIWCIVKHNEI